MTTTNSNSPDSNPFSDYINNNIHNHHTHTHNHHNHHNHTHNHLNKKLYACQYCCIVKHKMKKCCSCKIARYCSERCQSKHWNTHKHMCNNENINNDYNELD